MKPHEKPGFDRTSAAAWDAIVPGRNESVFNHAVYEGDDVTDALAAGASLVPPGQTMGHALIYAVWGRDYGLLKILLERGFDPNAFGCTAPGELPQTTLDEVYDAYHEIDEKEEEKVLDEMVALLRKHGGKKRHELPARLRFPEGEHESYDKY